MNDDKNFITNLVNTYSIREVVHILSDMDAKTLELHRCSSDDFLMFNQLMKKHAKDSKTISENARKIFEITGGEQHELFFKNLRNFNESLRERVIRFEDYINHSIHLFEAIQNKLNLMVVPLKNFRQNLMTLKFLDINLNLKITYLDQQEKTQAPENHQSIDQLVKDLKEIHPLLESELQKLKHTLNRSLNKLRNLRETNVLNVETILYQIVSSINLLMLKNGEAEKQMPELQRKTDNYTDSLNKIVTNLQYHDIIRQKMEHIQQTHRNIISDLQAIEKEGNTENNLQKQAKSFLQIRDVAGLQVAQLIHINKEYQNAIDIITKKMLTISEDMSDIASLCYQHSRHTYKTDSTHFAEIGEKLNDVIGIIEQFAEARQQSATEVETIASAIIGLDQQINKVRRISDRLETYAQSVIVNTKNTNKKEINLLQIVHQIKILAADVQLFMKNIDQLYKKTIDISTQLTNNLDKYNEKRFSINCHQLTQQASNILEHLSQNNESVSEMLNDNTQLANTIAEEIRASMNKIKYYDFFEKSIEEIIIELNTVNAKLESDDTNFGRIADNLKSIEALYTMRSERMIHDHIANKTDLPVDIFDDQNQQDNKDEDDDNLELF